MTIEGQRDLNDQPPKTIQEIRQKRLEFMNEWMNPRNRSSIYVPRQEETRQDPETMQFAALLLSWVLGEEFRAPKDWNHDSDDAKGWLVIPESERAYVEKPTGATFSIPGWEAGQTDKDLGYDKLFQKKD